MSTTSNRGRPFPTASGTSPDDGDATHSFPGAGASAAGEYGEDGQLDSEATVISSQSPIDPLPALASLRPRELGHLLEGRRLNHFQLEQFIGGGGMGAVFRARDTVLGRTVAVKVLAAGAAGNEETRLRFHNEAQSAARLDHPNIARVHYIGEDQGFNYIVFEYLQGKNLRDLVAEVGPLPLADALRFTLQIAEALAHAWQRDLVHRDIKPSNVLATPEGQVKLVDMGLARLRDVAAPAEDLTASGVTLGTFDYISPEQARDPRNADSRSDIYSLGCTLYFMLCGRPPFQGGTAVQKLLMHQSDEPPSPREYRPDLPVCVEQLLARMLAKSPEDRFQNPAELIAAIATVADEVGVAVYPTTTVQLTVTGQSSNWLAAVLPWLVPAVLLIVCVFAIDYLDRNSSGGAAPPWLQEFRVQGPPSDAPSQSSDAPGVARAGTGEANASRAPERPNGSSQGIDPDSPAADPQNAPSSADERSEAGSSDVALPENVVSQATRDGDSVVRWPLDLPARMAPWFDVERLRSWDWIPGRLSLRPDEGAPLAANAVVVNRTARTSHTSLSAAFEAASDGDDLEIPRDGEVLIDRMSLPILVERRISLRGGEGGRPVLRVITQDVAPAGGPPPVFTIAAGSQLELENIDLELAPDFPHRRLGGWRLFEMDSGSGVVVRGCRLTVRTHHERFDMRDHDYFFSARGAANVYRATAAVAAREPVRIDLQNVVLRGGDTLVALEGDVRVELAVQNAFFALRGFLYDAIRRESFSQGASTIELDHVTARLGEGAMRIKDIGSTNWLQAEVHDCVFLGGADAAVVEHLNISAGEIPLVWKGDGNMYHGWRWMLRQQSSDQPRNLRFLDWQDYWTLKGTDADLGSFSEDAQWLGAAVDEPLYSLQPADFLLSDAEQYTPSGELDAPPGAIVKDLPVENTTQAPNADGL